MKPSTIFAIALAMSSGLQNSTAESLQAKFSAIVTSTSAISGLPPVGTEIQGAITFDYDPASYSLANDCGPACTSYFYSAASYQYFVNLGSSAITSPYTGLAVSDNTPLLDPLAPAQDFIEFATKSQSVGYNLTLSGPSSSFSGTAIPSREALTALGQDGYFYITSPSFNNLLTAKVNSFSVSSVPEPSSVLLLALGIVAILAMNQRSRHIATPKEQFSYVHCEAQIHTPSATPCLRAPA